MLRLNQVLIIKNFDVLSWKLDLGDSNILTLKLEIQIVKTAEGNHGITLVWVGTRIPNEIQIILPPTIERGHFVWTWQDILAIGFAGNRVELFRVEHLVQSDIMLNFAFIPVINDGNAPVIDPAKPLPFD